MIVLTGLNSPLLLTQGFTGEASAVTASRGCVHGSDAARFQATASDSARYGLAGSDAARFHCTVTDEAC